ncbi:MAG: histidine--tRNA ligase [Candidatus Eisenbacteria bacterium]
MGKKEAARKYQSVRGTRDVLPPEIDGWHWLERKLRAVLARFGYAEIRSPVFEHTELFEKGTGESTDIVQKQMYTFVDRGGRSLTLRPEGTPSVARAVIEQGLLKRSRFVKLFYLGPMFRYDRPQAGRYRQFDQLGAELIGVAGAQGDAECIHLHVALLEELGLRQFVVKINSVGCPECRPSYSKLVREDLAGRASELCDDCRARLEKNPLRILDCKNEACIALAQAVPPITRSLCEECLEQYRGLKERLALIGVEFKEDPGLVRGLDYYTRAAFEVHHYLLGAQSALGGGGRYDGLIELYGGPPTPAVGFAAGLDRILLAVEKEGIEIPPSEGADVYVVAVSEKARAKCFLLASNLRSTFRVEVDLLERSLQAQMKAAHTARATFTLIIGDEELESAVLTLKDMGTGEQRKVPEEELVRHLAEALSRRTEIQNG